MRQAGSGRQRTEKKNASGRDDGNPGTGKRIWRHGETSGDEREKGGQSDDGGGEAVCRSEEKAGMKSFHILQRARNTLGSEFLTPDRLPLMVFLELDIQRKNAINLPKYQRVVSWMPLGAPIFMVFFRENERIVFPEPGSLQLLPVREVEPVSMICMADLPIPIRGRSWTQLCPGTASNTCLVCAYADEHLQDAHRQQRDAAGHKGCAMTDDALSAAATSCLARHPTIFIIDIAMYNGIVFSDHHPNQRRTFLDFLQASEKIPAFFRVQEVMSQSSISHNLPFTTKGGSEAEPALRKTVVELSTNAMKPFLYA